MSGAIRRVDDGHCVVPQAMRTGTMLERMRGLLARPPLEPGHGLLIDPCSAVHTVGMRYPLDLVFLSAAGRIMKLVRKLRPWRMVACPGARMVLELPADGIAAAGLAEGQVLVWAGREIHGAD